MNENTGLNISQQGGEENTVAKKDTSPAKTFYDIVSVFATAVIAVAFAFTFVFRTVGVVGTSMVPTLDNGDRLILTAYEFEPQYGDVVVTCQPNNSPILPDTLIKRIIATEGQTVDIDFENHIVYVDGVALDEPYINEPTADVEDFHSAVTVPEGCVFVMGDNRNHSTDSRDNRVGFIKEEYILGKVLFKVNGMSKVK